LAFAFTSSAGTELATFSGVSDVGSHFVYTGGSLVAVGAFNGTIYAIDKINARLVIAPAANLSSMVAAALPSLATSTCIRGSRSFAIDNNGTGYLALGGVGCPNNGVLEIALPSATEVTFFPDVSGVEALANNYFGHIIYADDNDSLNLLPSATQQ
jgi:hypothetical protein